MHLIDSPPHRSLLVLGYQDAATAADHVLDVLEHQPLGLEGIDDTLIQRHDALGQHRHDLSLLPDGHGWLLIEFGGETQGRGRRRRAGRSSRRSSGPAAACAG